MDNGDIGEGWWGLAHTAETSLQTESRQRFFFGPHRPRQSGEEEARGKTENCP